jgi:hypothetical protein
MNALRDFSNELKRAPVRTATGLVVEYSMFASAVFLAASLRATRAPMAVADRYLGLRLRDRFVDLIARISPG